MPCCCAVFKVQPWKTNKGVGKAGFVTNNYRQTDLMNCSRILQTSTGKVGEHLRVLWK